MMSYRVAAGEADLWMFDTVEEIADFVRAAHKPRLEPASKCGQALITQPAALIERAVELAGPDGLTRQRLMTFVFRSMSKERFESGCDAMLRHGRVTATTELRPNKKGGWTNQDVYRTTR